MLKGMLEILVTLLCHLSLQNFFLNLRTTHFSDAFSKFLSTGCSSDLDLCLQKFDVCGEKDSDMK